MNYNPDLLTLSPVLFLYYHMLFPVLRDKNTNQASLEAKQASERNTKGVRKKKNRGYYLKFTIDNTCT